MSRLQVFDPAMCCSTGVCGPQVDPQLPRFAADLEWLRNQGVEVERYNLAQQTGAFVDNAAVKQTLVAEGEKCLPLILLDGEIISRREYPSRDELAALAGVARDDIALAVATARKVKEAAAQAILNLAGKHLAAEREVRLLKIAPCCPGGPEGATQKCC